MQVNMDYLLLLVFFFFFLFFFFPFLPPVDSRIKKIHEDHQDQFRR